ncbi:hypothetical protein SH139x_005746 [Planctomycetaceae bacterium SH139]
MFEKAKLTKNVVWTSAAVVLLTALLGGDLLWSYWQGMQGMVRNGLRDATSIQFDLVRLEQAIEALTPTLQQNRKAAVELDVEIEYLANGTKEMAKKQKLARAEMQELRDALDTPCSGTILIDGQAFDRPTVESDLLRRLESYKQTEKQLGIRQALLSKRRQTLEHAVSYIRDNEREQIVLAELANSLNAELKLLEVASATSGMHFDQPDLAKTKQLATDIEKRIRTLQRLCDQDQFQHEVSVNLDRRTVTEQFDQTFANK